MRFGRHRAKGDSLEGLLDHRTRPGVEFADNGKGDLAALGLLGILMDGLLSRGLSESLLGVGGEEGLMGEGSTREEETGNSLTIVSLSLLRKLLLLFVGLGDWVESRLVGDLASVMDSFGSKVKALGGSVTSAISDRSGIPLAARRIRGLRRAYRRWAPASVMDAMLTSISVTPV